ncbi:MAG TPA: GGDEF domain-containing protein [Polyangia bacterium]|nr:GGDEF domain-containing protein [Polyangia bacterium]
MGFSSKKNQAEAEAATAVSPIEMALDTLANVLRILGEFALDTEQQEAAVFTRLSEQWAQHVTMASPPPGPDVPGQKGAASSDASRRDWTGVREFVREYCKTSTAHTQTVLTDLRQVIWVFIQNLNHSFAQDTEADGRIGEQLAKLETLAQSSSTSELKREVLATVVALAQIVEQRKKQHSERVEDLGKQVRTLGSELDSARKDREVDPLSGLYNRRAFDEYVNRSVELSRAFGQPVCLLLVDLDGFKLINDTFGHPEGDTVLRRLSDAMARTFPRKSDFVARFGGDEFAVVLRETSLKDGMSLGERLLKAARATEIEREGVRVRLSVSIGIGTLQTTEDVSSWLLRTDRALYQAKRAGRDRMVAADDISGALVVR